MRKTNLKNQILFFSIIAFIIFTISFFAYSTFSINTHKDTLSKTPSISQGVGDVKDGGSEHEVKVDTKESKDGILKVDPKESFSIIVLPDTQIYAKKYPEILCNQTQWVVNAKKDLNVMATIQLGDIVDSGGLSLTEWEHASKCLKKLSLAGIWTVLAGNHDTDTPHSVESGFKTYDTYFPSSLFTRYSWYKDHFRNNQNSFVSFESLGLKVGLISLSIEPDDAVLEWAGKILEANPDRFFIVSTHKYLLDGSNTRDVGLDFSKNGNDGESIWNELISPNCNARLVLNGHFHLEDGEGRLVSKNGCNGDVMQVIQDYQKREKGGNGRLRIYTFTPSTHKVSVQTYSPYTKTFEVDADSKFEFGI